MNQLKKHEFDVAIVGGGYVGLTAAIGFAKNDFKVGLIYKKFLPKSTQPSRLFAIANGSIDIFKKLQVEIDFENLGQKINRIRVVENKSNEHLDFDPKLIDKKSFGIMIEEHILHDELFNQVSNNKNITLYEDFKIDHINSDNIFGNLSNDINKISGKIVIVADGKKSKLRDSLGIETYRKNYNQIAVVADISHENSHEGLAIENFLSTGPLAVLPKKGGFNSSIVWTFEEDFQDLLKTLSKEFLAELLNSYFGKYLGKICLKSEIATFPLELIYAKEYYQDRFVLLGDALHSIHPLAGQGLNLCLRDLKVLHEKISESQSLGLDLANEVNLKKFYNERKADNFLMYEATNSLNALFSNNILPIKFLRGKGLSFINNTETLKKVFMKYATGFSNI